MEGEHGGGGGSATGTDERPREEEGCSWCALKGERREAKRGMAALGAALLNGAAGVGGVEERGGPGSVSTWRREKEGGGLA
jgi:hypothetical protein